MKKYAVIFTRKDWAGCTTNLAFKDDLDEAIKVARQEYQDILKNVENNISIEKSIELGHTEIGYDEDLFDKSLKFNLYHNQGLQEILVQEVEI